MDRRALVRPVLALAMTAVGVTHFTSPEGFVKIVPPFLPAPLLLVWVSGVAEIAGGVGLMIPRLRRAAAWGLVALYVAVFPANIHMALHDVQPFAFHVSRAAQWLRLPFQAVFIALAVWLAREPRAAPQSAGPP